LLIPEKRHCLRKDVFWYTKLKGLPSCGLTHLGFSLGEPTLFPTFDKHQILARIDLSYDLPEEFALFSHLSWIQH
ncbi:hypothetical protein M1M86_02230, partial [Dehalococcoidales bacterium]|nr:hypothetical protein [Dehalococcoidales bacterium]